MIAIARAFERVSDVLGQDHLTVRVAKNLRLGPVPVSNAVNDPLLAQFGTVVAVADIADPTLKTIGAAQGRIVESVERITNSPLPDGENLLADWRDYKKSDVVYDLSQTPDGENLLADGV